MNRGDPTRHLPPSVLDEVLGGAPPAPRDRGSVVLLVARGPGEARSTPERVELTVDGPLPGDRWSSAKDVRRRSQLTAMEAEFGRRVAHGQPLSLFGDNLVLDLALGEDNLPAGSRLRVGAALLEVTDQPHTGCKKYAARFGVETLAWISVPERRAARLRGLHLRVVEPGSVAVGDEVVVVERAPRP